MKRSKVGLAILAGGYGTIRQGVPKLLEPVAPGGVSMIGQAARNAFDTWANPLFCVTSRKHMDEVVDTLARDARPFVRDAFIKVQGEKRGAAEALDAVVWSDVGRTTGSVLVMFGDMPLWRPSTMLRLMEVHEREEAKVTLATVSLDAPGASPRLARYGRVIRDAHGRVVKVVEPADATPDELATRTVNPSLYVFDVSWYRTCSILLPYRQRSEGRSAEKEIPGAVAMSYRLGEKVVEVPVEDPTEALGVNTADELEDVRRILAAPDGIRRELGVERVALPYDRLGRQAGER